MSLLCVQIRLLAARLRVTIMSSTSCVNNSSVEWKQPCTCIHSSSWHLRKDCPWFADGSNEEGKAESAPHSKGERRWGKMHRGEECHALERAGKASLLSPAWVWTWHTCPKERRRILSTASWRRKSIITLSRQQEKKKRNKNVSRRLGIDLKIRADKKMIGVHFHFAAEAWCFLCLCLTSQSRVHQESPWLTL